MKNRLREERVAHGLSQGELAERMDVSRQTINAVEADKYDPSLPLAYKLAAFFDIPAETLFTNHLGQLMVVHIMNPHSIILLLDLLAGLTIYLVAPGDCFASQTPGTPPDL